MNYRVTHQVYSCYLIYACISSTCIFMFTPWCKSNYRVNLTSSLKETNLCQKEQDITKKLTVRLSLHLKFSQDTKGEFFGAYRWSKSNHLRGTFFNYAVNTQPLGSILHSFCRWHIFVNNPNNFKRITLTSCLQWSKIFHLRLHDSNSVVAWPGAQLIVELSTFCSSLIKFFCHFICMVNL